VRKLRTRSRMFVWGVIIVLLAGQAMLIYLLIGQKDTALSVIGWVTGAVIPTLGLLFAMLQRNSIWFYLVQQKFLAWFTDEASAWTLSVNFSSEEISAKTLDDIVETLLNRWQQPRKPKVQRINNDTRYVSLPLGPLVELQFCRANPAPNTFEATLSPYVQVYIRNYKVGYRQATHVITNEITPVLEDIGSAISGVNAKYTLYIEFEKHHNPFFGLYVGQLNPNMITSFSIRLELDKVRKTSVSISETRITINTTSQSELQKLAINFLTFDTRLKEQLDGGKLFNL
jgi:hypothetical protein